MLRDTDHFRLGDMVVTLEICLGAASEWEESGLAGGDGWIFSAPSPGLLLARRLTATTTMESLPRAAEMLDRHFPNRVRARPRWAWGEDAL